MQLHFDADQGVPSGVEVSLYDVSEGRPLTEPAECHVQPDRMIVVCNQLDPGLYELRVQVAEGGQKWSRRCEGLALDRFEERYECELDLTSDGEVDVDAGVGMRVDSDG